MGNLGGMEGIDGGLCQRVHGADGGGFGCVGLAEDFLACVVGEIGDKLGEGGVGDVLGNEIGLDHGKDAAIEGGGLEGAELGLAEAELEESSKFPAEARDREAAIFAEWRAWTASLDMVSMEARAVDSFW